MNCICPKKKSKPETEIEMLQPRRATFRKAQQAGITFGLELEFLVNPPGGPTVDQQQTDVIRKEVAKRLSQLAPDIPIAALCAHKDPKSKCTVCADADRSMCFPHIRVFTPAMPISKPNGNSRYLYFLVQPEFIDGTLDTLGRTVLHSLEVSTPVFDASELDAGLPQTAKAISALRNSELDITANVKCGLHIHVGIKSGITLELAKKVVMLTMLFEMPLLDALCPQQRKEITYYATLNTKSNLIRKDGTWVRSTKPARPGERQQLLASFPFRSVKLRPGRWNLRKPQEWLEMLTRVWMSHSFAVLHEEISKFSGEKCSLALCLRDEQQQPEEHEATGREDFNRTPSTFEFRYPQMNFDADFIRNWAELACKIMEISTFELSAFKDKFLEIVATLEKSEQQNRSPLEPLLKHLELGYQLPAWLEQLRRHGRGEFVSLLGRNGFLLPEFNND